MQDFDPDQLRLDIETGIGKDKQCMDRFSRIVTFYGYVAGNKNIGEFLRLPIDNPSKFRDTDRVVNKWRKPSSIRDMYGALLKVYDLQCVKTLLGDAWKDVVSEVEDFKKVALEVTSRAEENKTAQMAAKEDKSSEIVCDNGDVFENDSNEDTSELLVKDLIDLKKRLLLYCDILDDIDHHTVKAVSKFIKFDIQRYLSVLD